MVIGTAAHALPVLADGQFYGSASLFDQSGWSYTGTLPSSVSAGFRAENVDNVCIPSSVVPMATNSTPAAAAR